jgi:cyclic beta-1,2-glucan synthetase
MYEIAIQNPSGVSRGVSACEVDGKTIPSSKYIALTDDGGVHQVSVVLG